MKAKTTVLSAFFAFFAFFLASAPTHAETEIEEWYLSKGGEYLVRESINGNHHALLSTSKKGDASVYIIMFDSECKGKSSDVTGHNPLYINDKLVQYSQYCDDERRYFFPTTEAGRSYLINEFIKREFVQVKTHTGDGVFLFSAKRFSEVYQEIKALSEAI